jgi:hypothetical protein
MHRNRELGIVSGKPAEVFTVTAWGKIPLFEELRNDLPDMSAGASNLESLQARLSRWQAAAE